MKKKIIFGIGVILSIILILSPTIYNKIKKEPTDIFLSKVEIKEDGSIKVRELVKMNGEYNGMKRQLTLSNPNNKEITGTLEDIKGNSKLYDGSKITNIKVGSLDDDLNLTFDDFEREINYFDLVFYANNEEERKYTKTGSDNEIFLKLYNPSTLKEWFYIEYDIENVVVVHNDIAEFTYNVLGDLYEEDIGNFKVEVTLPNSDNNYRAYLHGPLNGNMEKLNDRQVLGTFNFLGAHNRVGVRLLFDKKLVPNATKITNLNAKKEIIDYQNKLKDDANNQRDKIRRQNIIYITITIIYVLIAIYLIVIIYLKAEKTRKTDFNMKYYRDFDIEYGPNVLEYLLNKKITEKSLSATILNLIYKKILKVEKIESKKEDYKLILQDIDNKKLTEVEKIAINIIINEVGNSKEVVLSSIKKYCSNIDNANSFMNLYNDFLLESKLEALEYDLFLKKPIIVLIAVIYYLLGFILVIFGINLQLYSIVIFLVLMIIGLIIYALTRYFYTKKGALEYATWMGRKRFLEDFSRFDEKELKEVSLWDKYLVYATVLGCAKKLSSQMKLKIDNLNTSEQVYIDIDPFMLNYMINDSIYNSINSSINQAVSSSRSSIAQSNNTTGSGFGGSIGGGGSFGGGGGGGRF